MVRFCGPAMGCSRGKRKLEVLAVTHQLFRKDGCSLEWHNLVLQAMNDKQVVLQISGVVFGEPLEYCGMRRRVTHDSHVIRAEELWIHGWRRSNAGTKQARIL